MENLAPLLPLLQLDTDGIKQHEIGRVERKLDTVQTRGLDAVIHPFDGRVSRASVPL